MHCPECGYQVDRADKFCRECGHPLRSIPAPTGDNVGGDTVGGHKVGEDYTDVGHIEQAKGVAVGEGNTVSSTSTTIQPPRPAGREISFLWGAFKYATFVAVVGLIILVSGVIDRDIVYSPSGPLSDFRVRIEKWLAIATPVPTAVELPVITPPPTPTPRPLLEADFMEDVNRELRVAVQHEGFLQDALMSNSLPDAKRHTEHVVNTLEGEEGRWFGDVDRNGVIENTGDGIGLTIYLDEAKSQAMELFDSPSKELTEAERTYIQLIVDSLEEGVSLVGQASDTALEIVAVDTAAEAQPIADEVNSILVQIQETIGLTGFAVTPTPSTPRAIPTPFPVCTVNSPAGLNLRSGPGQESAIVATAPNKAEAMALFRSNDNLSIKVLVEGQDGDMLGWAFFQNLECDFDISALSIDAATPTPITLAPTPVPTVVIPATSTSFATTTLLVGPAILGEWAIVAANSKILFSVDIPDGESISGEFTEFEGEVRVEAAEKLFPKVALDIVVESMTTEGTGRAETLASASFLDAVGFPTIVFRSSGFEATDSTSGELTGVMIVRDVVREVTFDVALSEVDANAGLATTTASTILNLAEWGLSMDPESETTGVMTFDIQLSLVYQVAE